MKYPLPHGYSFQIRRNGRVAKNGRPLVDAKIVSPCHPNVEACVSVADFATPFDRPTSRLSAGHVLWNMLYDVATQAWLGDAYPDIHDKALEMSGLCKSPE